MARLEAETEHAGAEGYSGLRVSVEMSGALKGHTGSERRIDVEAKLNAFLPGSGCLALCQYDRRRFDAQMRIEDNGKGFDVEKRSMRDPGYEALTVREQEILALLAEGQTLKTVGERLFISPKTVENHRTRIMRKLGVHSTFELIRYAAKIGIIDIDRWKE